MDFCGNALPLRDLNIFIAYLDISIIQRSSQIYDFFMNLLDVCDRIRKKSAIFTSIKYRLQRERNGRELPEGAEYNGRSPLQIDVVLENLSKKLKKSPV